MKRREWGWSYRRETLLPIKPGWLVVTDGFAVLLFGVGFSLGCLFTWGVIHW